MSASNITIKSDALEVAKAMTEKENSCLRPQPAQEQEPATGDALRTDMLDFPTAWKIQKTVREKLQHHEKCSSVPGHDPISGPAFLCDCGAIENYWKGYCAAHPKPAGEYKMGVEGKEEEAIGDKMDTRSFASAVSDLIWGGELGWTKSGLESLLSELKKRLKAGVVYERTPENVKAVNDAFDQLKHPPAPGLAAKALEDVRLMESVVSKFPQDGALAKAVYQVGASVRAALTKETDVPLEDGEIEIDLSGLMAGTHKIVPIEPTEEMINVICMVYCESDDTGSILTAKSAYKAMLSAVLKDKK